MVKRALTPVTTPAVRGWLIARRDEMAGVAATARSALAGPRLEPAFVVAGVQKGGTTYLYQELVRHPQVLPAMTKEVHYFDEGFHHGPQWYRGFFPLAPADGRHVVTGEASPGYLFHPWFAERVSAELPDALVIVLLRDPVARAYSQFLHERRLGYETVPSFADALALEDSRTSSVFARLASDPSCTSEAAGHHAYKARGRYVEQLERLHRHVPEERVLVLVSEEFYADPAASYGTVCRRLGLSDWRPEQFGRNDMAARAEPMDEGCRPDLMDHFAPYNARLEDYLGRELPWPR
jgi:Sulfotransferase domain